MWWGMPTKTELLKMLASMTYDKYVKRPTKEAVRFFIGSR